MKVPDNEHNLFKNVGNFYLKNSNKGAITGLIGEGSNGYAFETSGGLVLKVTISNVEAAVVKKKLVNHSKASIIKYYDITKINIADKVKENHKMFFYDELYCILMEKINTKSCWIRSVFYIVHQQIKNGKFEKKNLIINAVSNDRRTNKLLSKVPEYKLEIVETLYNKNYDNILDYESFLESLEPIIIRRYKSKIRTLYNNLVSIIDEYKNDLLNKPYSDIINKDNIKLLMPDTINEVSDYVNYNEGEVIELILSIFNLVDELVILGINNYDLHPDNVGIKDNKFVVFDIMDNDMRLDSSECKNLTIKEQVKESFYKYILNKRKNILV